MEEAERKTRYDLKPTPEKYCKYCGKKMERQRYTHKFEDIGRFLKRKYCSRDCMRKAFIGGKTDSQLYRPAHMTASRIVYTIELRERVCSKCGSTENIDVHHIDGNYNNNTSENLILLCRSCHMKEHHRKQMCVICGKPVKGHGLCNKHYLRYKKYGDPLMYYHKILNYGRDIKA